MPNIQEIIAQKIQTKYKEIEDSFQPDNFILNSKITELYQEIENIQKECQHEYENGYCKYCQKGEE
jgi:guanylate kinase